MDQFIEHFPAWASLVIMIGGIAANVFAAVTMSKIKTVVGDEIKERVDGLIAFKIRTAVSDEIKNQVDGSFVRVERKVDQISEKYDLHAGSDAREFASVRREMDERDQAMAGELRLAIRDTVQQLNASFASEIQRERLSSTARDQTLSRVGDEMLEKFDALKDDVTDRLARIETLVSERTGRHDRVDDNPKPTRRRVQRNAAD